MPDAVHLRGYRCPKCGGNQYDTSQLWISHSLWARMFELYNRRFSAVTCRRCRYTEIYRAKPEELAELFEPAGSR